MSANQFEALADESLDSFYSRSNVFSIGTPAINYIPGAASHSEHNSFIDRAFRDLSLATAAVTITPILLKAAGIGVENYNWVSKNCCPVTINNAQSFLKTKDGEPTYGIAGAVAGALGRLPVVGDTLSRGEITNSIAGGGLMVLGHYGGQAIERLERRHGWNGHIGRFVRNASQIAGMVLTLPALLPGIGHGAMILSANLGIDKMDKEAHDGTGPASALAGLLGKVPGPCKMDQKLDDGAYGALSVLVAQLCCAAPAIIASLPGIFSNIQSQGHSHGR